jgi:hypothetical protein
MKKPQAWMFIAIGAAAVAVGAGLLPAFGQAREGHGPAAPTSPPAGATTPEQTLRLYARAVNADDFDAQYALFAPVEYEGSEAIPLLPKPELRRLLAHFQPRFPVQLRISSRPLRVLENFAAGKPSVVSGFIVPVLDAGRPAPPPDRRTNSLAVAVRFTAASWRVSAYGTCWTYYFRAYGPAAGQRFREAYRRAALGRTAARS